MGEHAKVSREQWPANLDGRLGQLNGLSERDLGRRVDEMSMSSIFITPPIAMGGGMLTRGGKLFAGLYLSLWYVSLNGVARRGGAARTAPPEGIESSDDLPARVKVSRCKKTLAGP